MATNLEKENAKLKVQIKALKAENKTLKASSGGNVAPVIAEVERICKGGNSGMEKVSILLANVSAWKAEFGV